MAMVSYSPAEYEGKVIPGWAEFLGWMMTLGPVFCVIGGVVNTLIIKKIPVSMVYKVIRHARNTVFEVSDQVRHKPTCTVTEDG